MRKFINRRLNIALDNAIINQIDSEFQKWDGYPMTEYGSYTISQQAFCDALRNIGEALERKHGYNCCIIRLWGFKWSEVL